MWLPLVAGWIALAFALCGAYHWEPLRAFISIERLTDLSRPLAHHPVAPLVIAAAYFCSVLIVLPRGLLTVPAVIVFGPWLTFFAGMSGLLFGALCGLWFGRQVSGDRVQRLMRAPLLARLEDKVRCGGWGAVLLVRLVPVAPFTAVNIALGVLRTRTSDFVAGTFLGLLPGFLFTMFLGGRMRSILDGGTHPLLLALEVTAAAAVLFLLGRMAAAKFKEKTPLEPTCSG
jgi:uncharacterized membrane protein YdjX (TVP38/TMEM64 family)